MRIDGERENSPGVCSGASDVTKAGLCPQKSFQRSIENNNKRNTKGMFSVKNSLVRFDNNRNVFQGICGCSPNPED